MRIKTERVRRGYWRADCIDLPGTPYVGEGRNELEAMACLAARMIMLTPVGRLMGMRESLEVNGRPWKDPWRDGDDG